MRYMLTVAFVAALSACSGDDSDRSDAANELEELTEAVENAPPCDELYAAGQPTADVLDAAEKAGVCTHAGENIVTGLASFPCSGDPSRMVHYTGAATDGTTWGYGIDGDTWQPMPAGQGAPSADIC